ncbi:MAG TPA: response regulator [Gemmatimonadales bacterium]|jgi:signal transduction histidine kinase|nr:response regulator [Gemmatimonadales bacterium]
MAAPVAEPIPTETELAVRILLVDDQPANLVALKAILEGISPHIVMARSGREALKQLLLADFAVILLDVKMPEMDGFETATLIRERERSRNTPIIFLTAADRDAQMAVRGYAVGAVDYLIKPVVPEFVRSKVSVFVELARKNAELVRQAERLRASEEAALALTVAQKALIRDLEHKNHELESFSYAVSHDLRAPLRRVEGFARALEETGEVSSSLGTRFLGNIRTSIIHMGQLIDDVIHLARVTSAELRDQDVDLSAVARVALDQMQQAEPERTVVTTIRPGMIVRGDGRLLRIALENLLQNAWKFTGKRPDAVIEFGSHHMGGEQTFYVKDNGVGFDMEFAGRLFGPFQRLHRSEEFPGSGIGLATVRRVIHRHGGQVWAEGKPGEGAKFSFTLKAEG